MPKFDIAAALADGYSYSEIASYLSELHGFDLNAAKYDGIGEEEVAGFLSAREVRKPVESDSDFGAGVKQLGRLAYDFPTQVQGAAGALMYDPLEPEGTGARWMDVADKRNRERAAQLELEGTAKKKFLPGISVGNVQDASSSTGFSAVAMGPSIAGEIGATLAAKAPNPVVKLGGQALSYLGGAAGSAIAGKNMDEAMFTKQLLERANQQMLRTGGRPMTDEETRKYLDETAEIRSQHGLWEAGPEAVGNALEVIGLRKIFSGLAKGNLLGAVAGMVMNQATEHTTETITGMGQQPLEVAGGLSNEKPYEMGNPQDWGAAFKEQAPVTAVLGGVTGGAAGAAGKLYGMTRPPLQATPEPERQMPDFEAARQQVESLPVPTPIIPPLKPADFAGISAVPDALSAMRTQPTVTAKVDTATQQVENATTPKGYGNPLDTAGEIITAVRGADEAKLAELEKAIEAPELDDFAAAIRGDIAGRREELAKRPEILPADPLTELLSTISTADQPSLLQMADGLPGLVEGSPELAPYQRQLSEAISKRQRILWEESNVGRGKVSGDQGGVAARGEQVASSDGTGQLSEVSARGYRTGDANPVHGAGVEGLDNRDQGATGGRVAPEGAGEKRAGVEQASPLLTAARQHVAETGDMTMGGLMKALDVDIDTAEKLLEQVGATTHLPRNIGGTQAATVGADTGGFLNDQAIRKAGATSPATTAGDAQGFIADQGIRKAAGTATAAPVADTEGFVRDQQIRRDAMGRGPKPTRAADEPARAFLARKREWERGEANPLAEEMFSAANKITGGGAANPFVLSKKGQVEVMSRAAKEIDPRLNTDERFHDALTSVGAVGRLPVRSANRKLASAFSSILSYRLDPESSRLEMAAALGGGEDEMARLVDKNALVRMRRNEDNSEDYELTSLGKKLLARFGEMGAVALAEKNISVSSRAENETQAELPRTDETQAGARGAGMVAADNMDLASLGAAERAEVLRKRFPDARAIDILKLNRAIRESATGSVGSAVKGERAGVPKSWAEKNKKDDEYEKKKAIKGVTAQSPGEASNIKATAGGENGEPLRRGEEGTADHGTTTNGAGGQKNAARGGAAGPGRAADVDQPQKEQWEMTAAEWAKAHTRDRQLEREAIAKVDRLTRQPYPKSVAAKLRYLEKVSAAKKALMEISERADKWGGEIVRKEVIRKAYESGAPVPPSILAEFPELSPPAAQPSASKATPEKPAGVATSGQRLPAGTGARKQTEAGKARVEAAREAMRDLIRNSDIVGKDRADRIANAKSLVGFLQANAAKDLDTGYERGQQVAYTGEDAPEGMRSFIYLEGPKAGEYGVAATPEKRGEDAKREREAWQRQQDGFKRVRESGQEQAEKEPWQMTRAEFLADPKTKQDANHYNAVAAASSAGRPVPPEVLADYPDLEEKYGPSSNTEGQQNADMADVPETDFGNMEQPPQPAQAEAASGERGEEAGIVEHTTKRGKVLRGRIVTGISYRQAKEADPYTFKKDGGFFIREGAGEVKKDDAPAEAKETAPEKGEEQPKENLAIKRLRISAERLKAAGEAKLNQDRNVNTARRARMANNAEADARADIRTAETLLNIVNAQEDGTAGALAGLTSKAQLETLQGILTQAKYAEERRKEYGKHDNERPANKEDLRNLTYPYPHFFEYSDLDALIDLLGNKRGWKAKRNELRRGGLTVNGKERIEMLREALKLAGDDYRFRTVGEQLRRYDRLQKAGITDDLALREALERLVELSGKAPEKNRAQELERALVGQNNGIDFFPTPKAQAKFIVDRAGIEPGMRVLEPSAGTGNLAEEMRAQGGEVEVAEISPAHREVLEAKGFKIVEHDFMDMEEGGYDVIVMNPPFSNNMDIDHVRKAYELLKPGGRVVAIMGEGAFFRTGKKETEFREWLDEVGINEKLPEGFFTDKKELRTTGVNARVVEIDKPIGAETPVFDEKQEAVEAEQAEPAEDATVELEAETETATESPPRLHTVSGYPGDNATKKHMLEAIAEARKELPEPSPRDGFSDAERIDWPKPTTEKSHKIYRLAGNFKLVVDPTGYARLVEDMGSSGNDGSKIPDKVHGKPIGNLAEAKLWAEYYLLGKTEPSGPPHVFRGKNKEYEYTIPNSAYALDNFEKKVKGSSGVKFAKALPPSARADIPGELTQAFGKLRARVLMRKITVLESQEEAKELVARLRGLGASAPDDRDIKPPSSQRALNRAILDLKFLGSVTESAAFSDNGYDGLDVKTKGLVSEAVKRTVNYFKIFDPVVGLVPVEVVNIFTGREFSPEKILNDISVLKNLNSTDAQDSVSTRGDAAVSKKSPLLGGDATATTVGIVSRHHGGKTLSAGRAGLGDAASGYPARHGAELGVSAPFDLGVRNLERLATGKALESGRVAGALAGSGTSYGSAPSYPAKFDLHNLPAGTTEDFWHGITPNDVVLDGEVEGDTSASPFIFNILYSGQKNNGIIQGLTATVEGAPRVYLVADGIAKNQAVPVLLHELGEHAAQLGFAGDREYQGILRSLEKRAEAQNATGKAIRAAMDRVPEDTLPEHYWSEVAAYLVENKANSEIGIVKRILNFFKKWLYKAGAINADRLTPEDLVLFARSATLAHTGATYGEGVRQSVRELFKPVDTESAAFLRWFGDSKVVDADGKPLVVYRGDSLDPNAEEMKPKQGGDLGTGIYFAEDYHVAEYFTDGTDKTHTRKYYISLRNPFDLTTNNFVKSAAWPEMLKAIPDGPKDFNRDLPRQTVEKWAKGKLDVRNPYGFLARSFGETPDTFNKFLASHGFDGVIEQGTRGISDGSFQYVAFTPEQVKSATENTGAFSPSDPRIRYSKRFEADEAEIVERVKPALRKNDLKWWERVFKTFDYLSRLDPASKRIFQYGSEDRRENKVRLEDRILDDISVPDGAYIDPQYAEKKKAGFVSFLTSLQKKDKATYTAANDYLLTVDRTGKAFSVKRQEGYTVKSPDGEVLATGLRTKEDGYAVTRDHHAANYGKDSAVLKKDYSNDKQSSWVVTSPKDAVLSEHDTEAEAVAARREAEAGKMRADGKDEKTIAAVMKFREMTDRAFDLMAGDLRRVIDEAERLGLDEPTMEVVDERKRYVILDAQGNKVPESYYENRKDAELFAESISHKGRFQVKKQADNEILMPMTLSAAISQMGDLRGSYFPRQRQAGAVVLTATKDGSNIRKNFDLYMLGGERTDIETGEVLTESKIKTFLRDRANRVTPLGLEMARLKADGYTVKVAPADRMPETVFEATQLFASINALIEDASKGVKKDADPNLQRAYNELAKTLTMNIADTFKQRGYLSSRMKRTQDYWEGFETDMLKAGVQYAKGMAGGLAKREAAQKMTLALTGRETTFAEYQNQNPGAKWEDYQQFVRDNAIDPKKQPRLLEETKSWMKEMLRNDEQADRILGTIKGLAVLKFLGFRVSSAAVNMTNMVQAVPATIAAQTGTSISRALGQVGSSARAYKQYRTGKAEQSDKEIFTEISERGWDNPQFNHEAAAVLRSKAGNWFAKFTDAAMWMFGQAEKVNRAVTIHAAYVQAKRMSPDLGHVGWMNKAKQISDDAHGVYGKETAPAWTRGAYNPLKLAYTFQRFMHNYFLNMGQMWERGKYKELTWMLISPALIAGPGATLLTPIAASMLGALGIGGDDPEEEFYTWAEQTFGEGSTGARVARHGFSGALGVNLKGSLEMGFAMPTTVAELFGAPGSLVTDAVDSVRAFGKGEVSKGFEKALPTGMGTMLKANREQREGVTTGGYSPVWYGDEPLKTTGGGSVARFFGFNPSVTSGVREKLWSEKRIEQKYASERKRINDRIRRLVLQNGGRIPREDMDEIRGEVARYNERARGLAVPGVPLIKASAIRQAIRSAKRPPRKERLRTNPNI